MAIKIQHSIRTLRLKVKTEGYAWLNRAAFEVNNVWNYANATSHKAARPFAGPSKWLTAYDLDKLTAGATEYLERIGSETIQRINAEFATRRKQSKKAKLRWRPSRGSKRALGWIPFKAAQLKRKGKCLRFSGKAFRVFEQELLENVRWKCGCFAQDAVGDWWLCMPVEHAVAQVPAPKDAVGLDLGLKDTVATSDGDKLEAGHFYRSVEQQVDMLDVRIWVCRECGVTHDRDVNAARNILSAGRLPPSVSGNESSLSVAEPSQTYSGCEAGISAMKAAA